MHRIDDHQSDYLYDPWFYLGPKRRRLLEEGWSGLFRTYLFEELPVHEIKHRFHAYKGRPSKELFAMLGLLILQQLFDLTDEQTVETFAFRTDWHYALDIRNEDDRSTYVCERTLREYRRMAIELQIDEILFRYLTDKLLNVLRVPTGKQRLDSTHLCSNMKQLSRLNLFVQTIRKFLRELQRVHPRLLSSKVDHALKARYLEKGKSGCFSRVSGEQARQKLESVALDLLQLVRTFEEHTKVKRLHSFGLLQRVLQEQCRVRGEAQDEAVALKEPSEISSTSLQNPSDPDATYDGHKGQGYQAQLMETFQEEDGESNSKDRIPNLITYAEVEPAHVSDEGAVAPSIQETKDRGCKPNELVADTAYGSDDNIGQSARAGTELIAPAKGQPKSKENMLILDDFETDEDGEIVTCPAGETPIQTKVTPKGNYQAKFDPGVCRRCEFRNYCLVGLGKTNYRMNYTPKELRLAQRRIAEESTVFREKYRWRAGIEATNAKLKRKLKLGRLRVRGFGAVRLAVKLKVLGWNILQAIRAGKAGILTIFGVHSSRVQDKVSLFWDFLLHRSDWCNSIT